MTAFQRVARSPLAPESACRTFILNMANAEIDDLSPADAFRQMTESFGSLLRLHLRLARLELQEELARFGKPMAVVFLCLPAFVMAWVFLSMAVALFFTRWVPLWASVGLVGLIHGVLGACMMGIAAWRMRTNWKAHG